MPSGLNLTTVEKRALERLTRQLRDEGLKVTDREFLLALIRAAGLLSQDELKRLVESGMASGGTNGKASAP